MDKIIESIQRLKKEVIALNNELLKLEETYAQEKRVNDILRKNYDHMFNDYITLRQKYERVISISSENQDRILDEAAETLKTLGF